MGKGNGIESLHYHGVRHHHGVRHVAWIPHVLSVGHYRVCHLEWTLVAFPSRTMNIRCGHLHDDAAMRVFHRAKVVITTVKLQLGLFGTTFWCTCAEKLYTEMRTHILARTPLISVVSVSCLLLGATTSELYSVHTNVIELECTTCVQHLVRNNLTLLGR